MFILESSNYLFPCSLWAIPKAEGFENIKHQLGTCLDDFNITTTLVTMEISKSRASIHMITLILIDGHPRPATQYKLFIGEGHNTTCHD